MRVALAAVLFSQPDLLLLDEPTNYLDLEGTLWLENYVAQYPHTVLLISHDRDLLNRAVNSIVHLDQKKLTFWRGGYDQFERQRAEQPSCRKRAAEAGSRAQALEAFVDRFRAKASKARQAQSRIKALEQHEADRRAGPRQRAAVQLSGAGQDRGHRAPWFRVRIALGGSPRRRRQKPRVTPARPTADGRGGAAAR